MPQPQPPTRSRRRLRLAALAAVLAAAVCLLAMGVWPSLVPAFIVRGRVEAALADRMNRRVSVESARLRWGEGLTCTGVRVSRQGADDNLLARADRLNVRLRPLDFAAAVLGADVRLEALRVEGLELWLARGGDGRWNVRNLEPVRSHLVQVAGGTVHVDHLPGGRRLTLTDVHAGLGEIATTGQGYMTFAASLPGAAPPAPAAPAAKAGRLVLTANLNTADLTDVDHLVGTVKAEWQQVGWRPVVSALTSEPALLDAAANSSGRMSATFGPGRWQLEGAVEVTDVAAGGAEGVPARVPHAVLGFQLGQATPEEPVKVDLVKLSAPGVDLKVAGTVGTRAAAAVAAQEAAPDPHKQSQAVLRLTGRITWAAVSESIGLLRNFARRFERLGGDAALDLRLLTTAAGPRITGAVDLSNTLAVRTDLLAKEPGRPLRLDVNAVLSPDHQALTVEQCQLTTEAGRLTAEGRFDLAPGADRRGDAVLELAADVSSLTALRKLVPAIDLALANVATTGPVKVRLAASRRPTDAAPDAWQAKVVADATRLDVAFPGGAEKPADVPGTATLVATVDPAAGSADVSSATITLGQADLEWDGTCRLQRPAASDAETPWPVAARFAGVLTVAGLDDALRRLVPPLGGRDPAPLAGSAVLNLDGRLDGPLLAGTTTIDLEGAAIHIGDRFQKEAGRPASLRLDGRWRAEASHSLDGEAALALPGVTLVATGRGTVALEVADAKPDAEGSAGKPSGAVSVGLKPDEGLEIRADVTDLPQAIGLSPVLAAALEGRDVQGRATAHAKFSVPKQFLHVSGGADLTDASLDLGTLLKKPAGDPMHLDLSANLLPPDRRTADAVRLYLTECSARLGESVTRVEGRLEFIPPASLEGLTSASQVAALLRMADVDIEAECSHGAALRGAVPWLEPLYDRCGLDGPMRLNAGLSGSLFQGRLSARVDATECRIAKGEAVLKAVGTPASLEFEVRYGHVPGELAVESLRMTLGDADAEASGEFLFADPDFSALKAPTAWALRTSGRVPDLRALHPFLVGSLRNLDPSGGVTFDVQAAADAFGGALERCNLRFEAAEVHWLGRSLRIEGPIDYDGLRLATDGLRCRAGRSDVTLVAYVTRPGSSPTGALLIRGETLDVAEVQDMVREADRRARALAELAAEAAPAAAGTDLGPRIARRLQTLLRLAQLTGDIEIRHVVLAVPEWNATYDLTDLKSECRLTGQRFVVPDIRCGLNGGTIAGQVVLDFRPAVPTLSIAYDARDLEVRDNLRPLVDRTFPGMEVTRLSQRESISQRLEKGAHGVGTGETVCYDGLLVGPAAPDYITRVLPDLKLTRYQFRKMSNVFEHTENGDTENRMIFDDSYDIYIFGVTHADGTVAYTLGVDLSVGIGSDAWTRTLDQGKLPLLHYTGRIVGSQWAERDIRYVLPHEFAYDVFVRQNLLSQLLQRLGKEPPTFKRPPVVPPPDDDAPGP